MGSSVAIKVLMVEKSLALVDTKLCMSGDPKYAQLSVNESHGLVSCDKGLDGGEVLGLDGGNEGAGVVSHLLVGREAHHHGGVDVDRGVESVDDTSGGIGGLDSESSNSKHLVNF